MKVCIIGLGSIGKRHLKNLTVILTERGSRYQIDALRHSHEILPEDISRLICYQYYSFENLPNDYDVIFITNPTLYHYDTIKHVIAKTRHMFIEKPVFDSLNCDLDTLPLSGEGVYYVACPLRHKSIIKYVKQNIIAEEKILSSRIISTSYLPSWRKDMDYRGIYSAKRAMGGGVSKDLIHEWDYAIYLFGRPLKVEHMQGHVSDLEIDSDDVSIYIAQYQDMFLEIHLDYIGHKTERILQMFTNDRRFDVDLVSNTIYKYQNNELVEKKQFEAEDFYLQEMQYFLDCIDKGRENINTIANAYDTLKVALM